MPPKKKWKPAYDSERKYNKSWEEQFVWLSHAPNNSDDAYCKLCCKSLLPKLSNLRDHEKTVKHQSKVAPQQGSSQSILHVNRTPRLTQKSDAVKTAELHLAVGIACHSAIQTVDHIGEIITKHGEGSPWSCMKMHRTKCSALIKNLLSPCIQAELVDDFKDKKFAIIVDESTDISCMKNLAIMVRYFSEKEKNVATRFLCLMPITDASGEKIFEAMNTAITECGNRMENCIGYASDGASNMVGVNNSVWSRIRSCAPHCVLYKCICHSLALCIQHACDKLPTNIGYMLSAIPRWFSNSDQRRTAYQDLFDTMNPPEEPVNPPTGAAAHAGRPTPLPFERLSQTRWLVRGKIMNNILSNWFELQAYFECCERTFAQADTRYRARLIKNMLTDKQNFLYFVFMTPLVAEFESMNAKFQQVKADPHHLSQQLFMHHNSLHNRIHHVNGNRKLLYQVDFGAKFIQECDRYLKEMKHNGTVIQQVNDVKKRCQDVIVECLRQLELRLPPAKETFKSLALLSPGTVLNQANRASMAALPFLHLVESNIDQVEDQYRKLVCVNWAEQEVFAGGGLPSDTEEFWCGVLKHESFKDLALYALTCMITPISNATVERVFSIVTAIKTKPRNRMQLAMLDALVRLRTTFIVSGKCCTDFEITPRMLKDFKSDIVYAITAEESDAMDSLM